MESSAFYDPATVVLYASGLRDCPSLRQPDDDDQADKYELAHLVLGSAGFSNYEVSNWARPGNECAHNWRYWRQGEYLGFGCAAHSHVDGTRWWNVRTPDRFIERITGGDDAVSTTERLTESQRSMEALQLVLRTRLGVPVLAFTPGDLADFVGGGLVVIVDERVVLTVRGRLMANALSHRLVAPH